MHSLHGTSGRTEISPEIYAPHIDYFLSRNDDGVWRDDVDGHFETRDLGLADASKGAFGAAISRPRARAAHAADAWQVQNNEFRLLYVWRGRVTVDIDIGDSETLSPGDIGWLRRGSASRMRDLSDDLEMLEVTGGGPLRTEPLSNGQAQPAVGPSVWVHDSPDLHVADGRVRDFFTYRDLAPAEWTDGRLLVQEMQIIEPPDGGSGWHYHTMAQLFFVVRGWIEIGVAGRGSMVMRPGDAMCVSAGQVHDASDFSSDYRVVELCVPAAYETIAVTGPQLRRPASQPDVRVQA